MVVKQHATADEKIRQNLERLGLWEEPLKVAKAREPSRSITSTSPLL
jgi:hypothetical protein